MKHIDAIETLIATGDTAALKEINRTFLNAYCESKEKGAKFLDFHRVVWDTDYLEILCHLNDYDIKAFTVTSRMSGILSFIAYFTRKGWKVSGATTVLDPHNKTWCTESDAWVDTYDDALFLELIEY